MRQQLETLLCYLALAVALLVLASNVHAQTPIPAPTKPLVASKLSWQGCFIGIARTATFERRIAWDQLGVELNTIIGIGKRFNLQSELIIPVTANGRWLYRVQIGYRLF